jgi:LAO/AO transport system kinase
VRRLRPRGETLAIVAVDPSSRESGGALLGDRVRVRSGAADPGVLIRSMAARDRLGGLADGTRAAVLILAAAFDRVFVETVGVGQSEIEVAALVDTLVYVVNPGAGDLLQFMKAGILEVPDIIVVNKADLGATARRTAGEIETGLSLGAETQREVPPSVLLASARDGTGIDALVEALDAHRGALLDGDGLRERRRRGREGFVLEALELRYGSFGLEAVGGAPAVRARIAGEASATGVALVTALGREIEEALARTR